MTSVRPLRPLKGEAQPQGECRVISSVVVSFQVRPETVAEHVRLIEAVFEQLLPSSRTTSSTRSYASTTGCRSCTRPRRTRQTDRTPPAAGGVQGVRPGLSRPGRHAPGAGGRRHHRLVLPGGTGDGPYRKRRLGYESSNYAQPAQLPGDSGRTRRSSRAPPKPATETKDPPPPD